MAELTKAHSRQSMGKIKPTHKMVMILTAQNQPRQSNTMRGLICT